MIKLHLTYFLIILNISLFSQVNIDTLNLKGFQIFVTHGKLIGNDYTAIFYDLRLDEVLEKEDTDDNRTTTIDKVGEYVQQKGYRTDRISICNFDKTYKSFSKTDTIGNPFLEESFNFTRVFNSNTFQFNLYHIHALNFYDSLVKHDASDWESLFNFTKVWISFNNTDVAWVATEKLKPISLIERVIKLNSKSTNAHLIKAELHLYFCSPSYYYPSTEEQKKLCKKSIKKVLKLDPGNQRALEILEQLKIY